MTTRRLTEEPVADTGISLHPSPGHPPGEALADVAETNDDWLRRYSVYLFLLDAVVLAVVGVVAVLFRFGYDAVRPGAPTVQGLSYFLVAGLMVLSWLAVIALSRCYERRFLGIGTEEYRRLVDACLRMTALTAFVAFLAKIPFSRGFVAPFLLLGGLLLFAGRYGARVVLRNGRRKGRWTHRVLVVGTRELALELAEALHSGRTAGYSVVGACVAGGGQGPLALRDGTQVPVVGTLTGIPRSMLAVRADAVAVTATPGLGPDALRRLSYELEGTGVELLVAPALTNVSGTRVTIRPVAGLPLLHLDEPELSGLRKAVKQLFDVVVALILVIVLAPLLLGLAVAVRASSPGPALFAQQRVGRQGKTFRVYKLRSMYLDAEQRLDEIRHLNEHDGVLFKVRDDPRVTRIGRVLRRYSLDELPQLFNVLRGDMSLVGPRPPLADEVARYETDVHRRLLVKPGITGLWQVSGRSNLAWEDAVRLDLHYVENWSLGLDVSILLRTAIAVLARRGAY